MPTRLSRRRELGALQENRNTYFSLEERSTCETDGLALPATPRSIDCQRRERAIKENGPRAGLSTRAGKRVPSVHRPGPHVLASPRGEQCISEEPGMSHAYEAPPRADSSSTHEGPNRSRPIASLPRTPSARSGGASIALSLRSTLPLAERRRARGRRRGRSVMDTAPLARSRFVAWGSPHFDIGTRPFACWHAWEWRAHVAPWSPWHRLACLPECTRCAAHAG